MSRFLYFVCMAIFLYSCEEEQLVISGANYTVNEVDSTITSNTKIERLIAPYKQELEEEMYTVIGFSRIDLVRAKPEGKLNNFVADITLDFIRDSFDFAHPSICLMNYGGLRAPLLEGPILKKDIYQLMPFDNTIVVLKSPVTIMDSIIQYFKASGGEVIAGVSIHSDAFSFTEDKSVGDTVFIITTDYLANGGDRMNFLQHYFERKDLSVLLRDVLIQEVKRKDTIEGVLDQRVVL